MSQRYLAGFIQAGLFNPLAAPGAPTYTYELWSWGRNASGALGLGNTTNYSSPKQVGALTTWLNISSGRYAALATKTDGTLWSWGRNSVGQLGLGNTTYYSSPKQVGALTTWSKITARQNIAGAIKTDGTLWTWGANGTYGQLGLGDTTNRSSPVQVGALTNWANISFGSGHAIAIKTNGTLWSWGDNFAGQLGLGTSGAANYKSSPNQVGALTTWLNIAAGNTCSFATKTDGTLWSWGQNNFGQLGLGNITYYSSPKQVGALTTWLNIVVRAHTIATKTDGTLWSWGYNTFGQLGLGNTTNYSSPKQVGALTTWLKISAGGYYTIAAKTDGTLWAWGINTYGQLGLGNTTNYSSPKQVGSLTTWSSISAGDASTIALKY